MIEVQRLTNELALRFHIRPPDERSIDEIAFVHLITMRFSGKCSIGEIWKSADPKEATLEFIVTFTSREIMDEAASHCRATLLGGKIASHYLGALDKADPGRRLADRMLGSAECT